MGMFAIRFREFLRDDAGAEVVEFAIILASFTIITLAAVSYLDLQAQLGVNNDSNSLSNGALSPP